MMSVELSVDSALSRAEEKNGGYNVEMSSIVNGTRRPRTSEDFYLFCTYVLQYENYGSSETENSRSVARSTAHSPPLDSSGSSVNSDSTVPDEQREGDSEVPADIQAVNDPSRVAAMTHDDNSPDEEHDADDHDSFDLVTCFCGKPFAGRPMIECSICLTWIHLSCARIKKTNIPDVFHCALCKSGGATGGRRTRPSAASAASMSPTLPDRHRDRSATPPGHTHNTDKAVKRPKRTSPSSLLQDV